MSHSDKAPSRHILYVHGHAMKPDGAVLHELVLNAVRSGIGRDYPDDVLPFDEASFESVYYGDLTNGVLLTAGATYDQDLDLGDRRNALLALQAILQRKKFGFRQYDNLPGKTAMKEFVADIGAPVLGAMGLTLPLMSKVAPDFAAYLRNEANIATRIRERFRTKLIAAIESGATVMILAHGMGGAIAFDVLWQLSRDSRFMQYSDTKIDCLVTMGSPLCDNNVRKYLLGAGHRGMERYPGTIISWHNLAAEDDYVCHDGTVADDFDSMMKHRIISRIQDYRIFNLAVRYGRSNPHSSVGYLIHPRLAKLVRDWIAQP